MAAPANSRTDPALAMVATCSARLPDAKKIAAAVNQGGNGQTGFWHSLWKGRSAGAADDCTWEGGTLCLPLHGGQLAVSRMPAPIPWSELAGPCETSWWWADAADTMRAHTHHFLVALIGGSLEPVERRLALTKAVAAVVEGSDALGVYWGEGTLVQGPAAFLALARAARADDVPAALWIDVRVEPNPDGTARCFTTGLSPLGFLEIEVPRAHLPPHDLFGFIGDTACYIVNNRLQIPDGDTIGRTATEKYKVRHARSMFDRGTVLHVLML